MFCRLLLKNVLENVTKQFSKEEFKVLKDNSWAYKFGHSGSAEFHINKNKYLPKGFYWSGRACNMSEAKAKGWQAFIEERNNI